MVRFARADGSKGANKRVLEEATPWSEMVTQMKKAKPAEKNELHAKKKKKKLKSKQETSPQKVSATEETVIKKKCKKKKKRKEENIGEQSADNLVAENDQTSDHEDIHSQNENQEESETHDDKQTIDSSVNSKKAKKNLDSSEKVVMENGKKYIIDKKGVKKPWFKLSYCESDCMTKYEGFWMTPEKAKEIKELTLTLQDEDQNVRRKKLMKAKRVAHKELTRALIYQQKYETYPELAKKENNNNNNNNNNKQSVRNHFIFEEDENLIGNFKKRIYGNRGLEKEMFDGYWITKDGAERLRKLHKELKFNGISKEELKVTMKKERRKEEHRLRRLQNRVCLRCRQVGHLVHECPEAKTEFQDNTIICYKCGSTEHQIGECTGAASQTDEFPHATCFICKKVGHISRQCPDNPRGLYPNGGGCRGCGSVEHLATNCPVLKEEKEASNIRVQRTDVNAIEALDIDPVISRPQKKSKVKKTSVKVVKF